MQALWANHIVKGTFTISDAYVYQHENMPESFEQYAEHCVFVVFYRDPEMTKETREGVIMSPAQYDELRRKWEEGTPYTNCPMAQRGMGICIDTRMGN